MPNEMVEKVARAIAAGLGDDFSHAFASKSEWNASRGEKGGRFRDINEPRQSDYLDAARLAIEALMEPSDEMQAVAYQYEVDSIYGNDGYGLVTFPSSGTTVYQAMLRAALGNENE